jgi:hypothetical protein
MKKREPVEVKGGMLLVDGVKVARVRQVDDRACLEFIDKDRRRIAERGSREVCVPVDDLATAVRASIESKGDKHG